MRSMTSGICNNSDSPNGDGRGRCVSRKIICGACTKARLQVLQHQQGTSAQVLLLATRLLRIKTSGLQLMRPLTLHATQHFPAIDHEY